MNRELEKSACAEELKHQHRAEREELDRKHNVITDLSQLKGWEITELLRWKEGVVQYTAYRMMGLQAEQKTGYARDEVFAKVQIPD